MGMCYTIQTEQLATKQVSAVNAILYLHDFIEDQPSLYRYTPLQDPTVRGSRGARIYIHESGRRECIHVYFFMISIINLSN